MKLIVRREQDQGFLGGMNFILHCKVNLTSQETELIKKYKAHKEVLVHKERGGVKIGEIKIGDLVEGVKFKAKDITELLSTEDTVKEACGSFKNYIEIMASFGGEQVIEY
jgi:hypothetical protein